MVLTGCATYHPRPLSAPANATQFSHRSLDNADLRAFMQAQLGHAMSPWPPKAWTLDQLTVAALHYHPKLALARAQWASARAKAITAGAYPNPTLNLNPVQYATNAAAGLSPWTVGLAVDMPILTAGKRSHRVAEALDQAEAARLNVVQTAWQIRANVRQPWIKLYAARRRVQLLDTQVQDAAALLAALEQRFKAGQTSQYQVVQARLQRSNAQLSRADARAAENQARASLAGALGVPLDALRGLHYDFNALRKLPAFQKIPRARFKTYALTRRPDIRAALMRYTASEQAVRLEIARQYPNLNIGPGYTWDQGAHKWSIGLSLDLPVFNQNQGPIAEARAQRQQRAARFRVLQARITTDFNRALAAYQASAHKLQLAQHLLKSSQSRLGSARASYRAGETNRLDLLRIQLETQTDRLALLKARVQAEKALGALADTVEYPLARGTPTARAIQNVAPPQNSSHARSSKASAS
ncbi:Heavy metal RND efflux outer membrane protein, CzcC family [Salinisphaera sp. LB1]|nr:Heavy metal RND efflux outer membrane protein, CzcC family [Salinisphaera sp. LB1]